MSDTSNTGLPPANLTTTSTDVATIPQDNNGYIQLPITVDPLQLTADAFGFIAAQIPGWVPYEGHLESWLIEACARMVSTSAQVASQVPIAIFEYFGGLVGITPDNGAYAQVATTWTMVDSQGYTVPAGTLVAWGLQGSQPILFQTLEAFTVPTGATQTDPGAVICQAITIGSASNAVPAGPLTVVSSLSYVVSCVAISPAAGGADPETTNQYINRLSNELQLLTPRPILASDFAALAAAQEGVGRALGIDNFNATANMLSAADASFGSGVGTWTAVSNCHVAQSVTWPGAGSDSLAITSVASGNMTASSGAYPVAADTTYTAMATFHAATTAESCTLTINWYDINGNFLSGSASSATNDSTTAGVAFAVSAQSPVNAAKAKVAATINAGSSGDTHYVTSVGLFLGSPSEWSPGGQMSGQERCVTVVVVDDDGNALTSVEMDTIETYLQSLREINFLVFVVPPTYEAVTISVEVAVASGFSAAAVQAAVVSALGAMLSPATWAGGSQTPPVWLSGETVIYYLSVAATILDVAGVDHIVTGSLTLNGTTNDYTFAGYASLPQPSITVTTTSA